METLTETPLTKSTYFILLSLSPQPKHGYAIMKDVQALSENRIVLSTGTLYGALKRLLDLGWIIRLEDAGATGAVRDRKVYRPQRTWAKRIESRSCPPAKPADRCKTAYWRGAYVNHPPQVIARLYHLLLRAYPREYLKTFGNEMYSVFREGADEAWSQSPFRFGLFLLRELRDAPRVIMNAHWQGWKRKLQKRIQILQQLTSSEDLPPLAPDGRDSWQQALFEWRSLPDYGIPFDSGNLFTSSAIADRLAT